MVAGVAFALAIAVPAAIAGGSGGPVEIGTAPGVENTTPRVEGTNLWFVELKSPPSVKGTSLTKLKSEKQAFREAAANAGVSYTERYAFNKLWNGFSLKVDPSDFSTLTQLPGVKAVYPVGTIEMPKEAAVSPDLVHALAMTGADAAQSELGFTGEGVKVAVMDTGLDYDHADLGGDGVTRQNSSVFPTSRVVSGYDLVGDSYNATETSAAFQPTPHPDGFPDDCAGHGTHVSGIVGASGDFATGGARGVAPGVTFGAYRVFGCAGATTDDVMIAAMERIADDDDVRVLNMSIGDAFNTWPDSPTAFASDNLVNEEGVIVVASIGNSGADGVYSAGAPGVGKDVIGVASYDNTHIELNTFTVTPDDTAIGYQGMTGAADAPTSGSLELAKTGTTTTADDGCAPLLAGSLEGKAALIRRGTCTFRTKAVNAVNAGAAAVVIYNNAPGRFAGTVAGTDPPGDVSTTPVVSISNTEGALLDGRISAGMTTLTWTNQQGTFVNPTAGLISSFSSYGLTANLDLKPDLGAPGGLIRSTYPLESGGYTTISGTSMASPHVAGSVALLLEAHPGMSPAAVRDTLQNTAVPAPWSGNPGLGFLEAVHRQGAGLVKIDKAIEAPVTVSPGKLSVGEVTGSPFAQTLTLTNTTGTPITYDLSKVEGMTTGRSTFAPSFFGNLGFAEDGGDLTVDFSATSVTVPANGSATVGVSISAVDETAVFKIVYGGYIVLTPQGGGQVLRVPFAGYAGDYQAIPVMTGGGTAAGGGTNEVQRIAITGSPTGGTFTLSFTPPAGSSAETTGDIAFNATAAAVRTALAALPSIGSTANVNTSVGPLPGTAVNVTFQGTLGSRNIPEMTATSSLTGGTSPAVALTTTTQGATRFPKLAKRVGFVSASDYTATYTFPEVGTITYTMAQPNVFGRKASDIPTVGVHLDHQARWLKITVLDASGNPVSSESVSQTLDPVALNIDYMPRNQTAGGFFAFGWDGRLVSTQSKGKEITKNMPDGNYKLKVEVLKALGTAPADVETYTSPTFTIDRP